MSSLPAIPPVPRSALIFAGTIVALIVVWLWARVARTRHVVIRASESVQATVIQLDRIANALERIAILADARNRATQERDAREAKRTADAKPEAGHVAMSAFGR